MTTLDQRLQKLTTARLYAIVDTGYVPLDRIAAITEQLVLGGVDLIQLRAKKQTLEQVAQLGQTLRDVIPPDGPLFVLNDHPELVAAMDADGIHVGQDDLSVAEARARAGEGVIVGKSTHALDQAVAAEKEGADYIGVGPIYATLTKPDYIPVGPPLIGQVRAAVQVPSILHRRHQRADAARSHRRWRAPRRHRLRAPAKRRHPRLLPPREGTVAAIGIASHWVEKTFHLLSAQDDGTREEVCDFRGVHCVIHLILPLKWALRRAQA